MHCIVNIAECLFPCILFPFDFFLDNHNCPFPHCDVMPGPSHKARQLAWKYGRGAAWQSLIVNCCCVGMEVFQLNLNLPCQHGFNTEYVYRTLVIYIYTYTVRRAYNDTMFNQPDLYMNEVNIRNNICDICVWKKLGICRVTFLMSLLENKTC